MNNKKEVWLNLGCGVSLADDFVNVDNFFDMKDLRNGQKTKKGPFKNARVPKGAKFVRGDMRALPFDDNYADYIECNDAIEHMALADVQSALAEMYRVLKPGGKLAVQTTNFDELAKLWTLNVANNPLGTQKDIDAYVTLSQVIYGNQAGPGEFHRTLYNPYILGYHLRNAGFKLEDITITIYPTNSKMIAPQKAYKHMAMSGAFDNSVILTEMMWAECIKK